MAECTNYSCCGASRCESSEVFDVRFLGPCNLMGCLRVRVGEEEEIDKENGSDRGNSPGTGSAGDDGPVAGRSIDDSVESVEAFRVDDTGIEEPISEVIDTFCTNKACTCDNWTHAECWKSVEPAAKPMMPIAGVEFDAPDELGPHGRCHCYDGYRFLRPEPRYGPLTERELNTLLDQAANKLDGISSTSSVAGVEPPRRFRCKEVIPPRTRCSAHTCISEVLGDEDERLLLIGRNAKRLSQVELHRSATSSSVAEFYTTVCIPHLYTAVLATCPFPDWVHVDCLKLSDQMSMIRNWRDSPYSWPCPCHHGRRVIVLSGGDDAPPAEPSTAAAASGETFASAAHDKLAYHVGCHLFEDADLGLVNYLGLMSAAVGSTATTEQRTENSLNTTTQMSASETGNARRSEEDPTAVAVAQRRDESAGRPPTLDQMLFRPVSGDDASSSSDGVTTPENPSGNSGRPSSMQNQLLQSGPACGGGLDDSSAADRSSESSEHGRNGIRTPPSTEIPTSVMSELLNSPSLQPTFSYNIQKLVLRKLEPLASAGGKSIDAGSADVAAASAPAAVPLSCAQQANAAADMSLASAAAAVLASSLQSAVVQSTQPVGERVLCQAVEFVCLGEPESVGSEPQPPPPGRQQPPPPTAAAENEQPEERPQSSQHSAPDKKPTGEDDEEDDEKKKEDERS